MSDDIETDHHDDVPSLDEVLAGLGYTEEAADFLRSIGINDSHALQKWS